MGFSIRANCQKSTNDLLEIKNQAIGNFEINDRELSQPLKNSFNSAAPTDYGKPPRLSWIEQFGGSAYDYATAMEVDKDGNSFIAGSFAGKIEINKTTYNTSGNREAFVAKFNPEGDFQWITTIPASANNKTQCNDICLDTNGNVFVTGYYTGSVNVGSISFPDKNNEAMFYAKLNSNGNIINGNYHSKNYDEKGLSIDNDPEGNVFIISHYKSESDQKYTNSYLLKFNTDGILIWEKNFEKFFTELIIVDSSVYYCGIIFAGENGYVDPNVTLSTSDYIDEVFVLKSDLNAEFEWGFASSDHHCNDFEEIDLTTDKSGTLYLAGHTYRDATFGEHTYTGRGNYCLKFDELGKIHWLIDVKAKYSYRNPIIIADGVGNKYMALGNEVFKINDAGTYELQTTLNFSPYAMSLNKNNELLLSGEKDGLIYLTERDNKGIKQWDYQFKGNSALTNILDIECDNDGNSYAFAYSSGTTQYFGKEVKKGFILSKHAANGNLIWHKNLIGNIRTDDATYCNSIDLNIESGSVFVTGVYTDTMKISNTKTLSTKNEYGVFILKYDLNGNLIWDINEEFNVLDPSVVCTSADEVILSFTFEDTLIVNNDDKVISKGGRDGCFIKYSADGEYQWLKQIGGKDQEYLCLPSSDTSNNIYITSEYNSENLRIDDTEITLNEGDGNILLLKFEQNGTLNWWKTYGKNPKFDAYNWQTGIEVDNNENIILKGMFKDTVYFDDIMVIGSLGYYDYFITKIDMNGKTLWAKSIKTINSYGFNYNLFDLDNQGNIYFGAQIKDTICFDLDYTYWTNGTTDLFICKYSSDGELDWVKTLQAGSKNNNHINSVKLDCNNNVIVSGSFKDKITMDSESVSADIMHGFLLKLTDPNTTVNKVYDKLNNIEIYPNPASDVLYLSGKAITGQSLNIINTSGQIVYTEKLISNKSIININKLPKGVYFIKISGSKNEQSEKLIIM